MERNDSTFTIYADNVYDDFYNNKKYIDEKLDFIKFYMINYPELNSVISFKN